jgi:enolase
MTKIVELKAREILDSRGVPTIEVDVRFSDGSFGRAAAPSGGSRGRREPLEARDGDESRYAGRGVRSAVDNVQRLIAPAVIGMEVEWPSTLDDRLVELDGTPDRGRLGANAMLAVSLAATQALAQRGRLFEYLALSGSQRLPVPMFNVLNGGAHADNTLDFEEFMVAPVGASSFSEALRMGVEIYGALRALLKRAGLVTSVGDEGGFAPDLDTAHRQPLDLLVSAIEHAGLKPHRDVVIAVDVAAGALLDGGSYVFRKSLRHRRNTEQLIQLYASWVRQYPLWSIEDGLAEGDVAGWQVLTSTLGSKVQLVGDDLFVTNAALLREGIACGLGNAVLIKLDQAGTVSGALETIAEANRSRYGVIVSHRAGETASDFIADLAVAVGAGQIKAGAPVRGERVAKYNQLLRIEEALGPRCRYAGHGFTHRGSFLSGETTDLAPVELHGSTAPGLEPAGRC